MNIETLSIVHDGGQVDLSPNTLLVAIDETGHELFLDSKHPVFGLGGCAVLIKDYERLINRPWRYMKNKFFDGSETLLHASALRSPTKQQVEELGHFFKTFNFYRFAVMAAEETFANHTEYSLIQAICALVLETVAEIASASQPTEIAFFIESSTRIEKHIAKSLYGYTFGNAAIKIAPKIYIATKRMRLAFLEVADFVIQPAGAHVRSRYDGKMIQYGVRKDFNAVFNEIPRIFAPYKELLTISPRPDAVQ